MIYILLWIIGYVVIGIGLNLYMRIWEIDNLIDYNKYPNLIIHGPIKSRIGYYDLEWFISDVKDVVAWPINYIDWKIAQIKYKNDPDYKKEVMEEFANTLDIVKIVHSREKQ